MSVTFIVIIILLIIQSIVLPVFIKQRFLLNVIPVGTLLYGGYSVFYLSEYENVVMATAMYTLLSFVFFMSGYVSRLDKIKHNQEKVSSKQFRDEK